MNPIGGQVKNTPLRTQLAVRLGWSLFVATVALVVILFSVVNRVNGIDDRRTRQVTIRFYEQRLLAIQDSWQLEANLMRSQLEFGRVLDIPDRDARNAQLTALLTSFGGESIFTHVVLAERATGLRLFSYRTRSQQDLRFDPTTLTGSLAWAYGDEDKTLYRAIVQDLPVAGRGARLILFVPVDHSLLQSAGAPDIGLELIWKDATVASAGSIHTLAHQNPSTFLVPWPGAGEQPQLRISRDWNPAIPLQETLLFALIAAGTVALLGWLVLGRWLSRHAGALRTLTQANERFALHQTLDGDITGLLRHTNAKAFGEVRALAVSAENMMLALEAGRRQLAQTNADLEARVSDRTRDLINARDAAVSAAKAKEEFFANMSLELRTPLTGMIGALELFDVESLNAPQREMLSILQGCSEALSAVINELLDLAKIDAGKLNLNRERFNPYLLVGEVGLLFRATAARKGLALHIEARSSGDGLLVLGDSLRLRQVLLNLTGNALKFTDVGVVTLRVYLGSEPVDEDHVCLVFEVEDTGVGIDPEAQLQVFSPFIQAHRAAMGRATGTGLGLAISQKLVQAMGSEIALKSTVGTGSRFSFQLQFPVAAPGETSATPNAEFVERQLVGRVLLVDDNLVNRIVGGAMLQHLGINVVECDDGAKALALIEHDRFDLVLMDCQMPVLDGWEATRRLRQQESQAGARRLPVVALTASALPEDLQRCVNCGMDATLTKPFKLTDLGRVLSPWLGRQR